MNLWRKRPSFVLVVAVLGLAPRPALSADMAVKIPAPPPGPVSNWTGCYLGLEGGGAWGRSKQTDGDAEDVGSIFFSQTIVDTGVNGGLIGGTAGCNYQTTNVVWSIEGDLSWANLRGQANVSPPFTTTFVAGAKVDWLSTVRGRIGYATGPALLYVTAGVAFAGIKATEPFDPGIIVPGPLPDVRKDRTGWTAGAGVEWQLPDPHWSVKAEYLYVGFGSAFYVFEPIDLNRNVSLHENIVRAGLNLHFK